MVVSSESDGEGSDGSEGSSDLTCKFSAGSVDERVALLRFKDVRDVDGGALSCSHGRLLIEDVSTFEMDVRVSAMEMLLTSFSTSQWSSSQSLTSRIAKPKVSVALSVDYLSRFALSLQ